MRREYDRSQQELQKQALKVKGQEFVLAAQISIMKDQNQKLPDSPQAKELEKFTDFFMNETENLKKFDDNYDL